MFDSFNIGYYTDDEELELSLLATAIYQRYGYDFRNYKLTSFKARILHILERYHLKYVSELQQRILHHPDFFSSLVNELTVTVTEPFRDPGVFRFIRTEVIPYLKTFATIKVWHAGCSTGDEVFAMAMLLREEGLLDRSILYASDINTMALSRGRLGYFSNQTVMSAESNYQAAGGQSKLTVHLLPWDDGWKVHPDILKRVVFVEHDLTADGSLGEMQLIFCRNVLIYFNAVLQEQVFTMFRQSLCPRGFLCLGKEESLGALVEHASDFEVLKQGIKVYRRRSPQIKAMGLLADGGMP